MALVKEGSEAAPGLADSLARQTHSRVLQQLS